ncbi:MAG: hypothetical protein WBX22_09530 [Silvibacterium sp.]
MNVAITVDRMSCGKEHFEALDGLRETAAILIVLFHIFNYPFGFRPPLPLMHHAYLAVDFFFGLSGFVVAYAYDDRWTWMTLLQFSGHHLEPHTFSKIDGPFYLYSDIQDASRKYRGNHLIPRPNGVSSC